MGFLVLLGSRPGCEPRPFSFFIPCPAQDLGKNTWLFHLQQRVLSHLADLTSL